MQRQAKRVLVLTLGGIFILLGLVGFVLPFLQGVLFTLIGLLLISYCFPQVRLWINKHTQKYPHLSKTVKKIEKWMAKVIGEI